MNYINLSKKDLIYTLLRSEKATQEENYLKYINNINNTTDSQLYQRINDIRIQVAKLGKILTNKEIKIIREELYKLEHQEKPTRKTKRKSPYLS